MELSVNGFIGSPAGLLALGILLVIGVRTAFKQLKNFNEINNDNSPRKINLELFVLDNSNSITEPQLKNLLINDYKLTRKEAEDFLKEAVQNIELNYSGYVEGFTKPIDIPLLKLFNEKKLTHFQSLYVLCRDYGYTVNGAENLLVGHWTDGKPKTQVSQGPKTQMSD